MSSTRVEHPSLDPLGDRARDPQLVLRPLLRGDALTTATTTTRSPTGHALHALANEWRVLSSAPASGARNMATDAALLAHARRTGTAIFRTYSWSCPTLSLGRHERGRGLYDPARLDAHGVDIVRRPTGGRALLHHRELTYSVAAPIGTASLGVSYSAINSLLRDALARLGVGVVEAVRTGRSLRPEGSACFATPSPGELVWQGRKLVGSAQLREAGALLQHGSILLEDDQGMIASLRSGGSVSAATAAEVPPAATLSEALGRSAEPGEVRDAIADALAELLGSEGPVPALDPASLHDDLARLEDVFRSSEWTWRR